MKKTIQLEELIIDSHKYYIFFPKHYGDTFAAVGFVRWFEKSVNGKVVCLIRPDQELIMRLFEIDEYEMIDFNYKDKTVNAQLARLSDQCPIPRKGGIFVAWHVERCHRENKYTKQGRVMIHRMEHIGWLFCAPSPLLSVFQAPTARWITVSDKFRKRLTEIAPLGKIVLFSPCSHSWNYPGWEEYIRPFWEEEDKKWTKQGFKVVVSSIDPVDFPGAIHLPMSMEEALWLGIHCHYVVARRSGYIDLLFSFREEATIIYPSYDEYSSGNINGFFNKNFHEIIMPDMAEQEEKRKKRKKEDEIEKKWRSVNQQLEEIQATLCGKKDGLFLTMFQEQVAELRGMIEKEEKMRDEMGKLMLRIATKKEEERKRESSIFLTAYQGQAEDINKLFTAQKIDYEFICKRLNNLNDKVSKLLLLPSLRRKLQWIRWRTLFHFGASRQKYMRRRDSLEKQIHELEDF